MNSKTLLCLCPCPCPSRAAVKYLLIVILLVIIQYLDIASGKHWQTTRHYKFNVTIYTANYLYYVGVHSGVWVFDYINLISVIALGCR